MDFNGKHRDWTHQSFKDLPLEDFPEEIIGGCFYQENSDTDKAVVEFDIFPTNLVCMFTRCNLTNVKIHTGMTLVDCQVDRICVQQDMMDWKTDNSGNPIEPNSMDDYIYLGIPTDPTKIVNVNGGDYVVKEVIKQLAEVE